MTIQLKPKRTGFLLTIANKTWFGMLDGPLSEILPEAPRTNDPITVSSEEAKRCAEAISHWQPYDGWVTGIDPQDLLTWLYDFFINCEGFETA